MKTAFEGKSTVSSIINLPIQGANHPANIENTIITASTDRCVQAWTLTNDISKPGEKY